MSSSHKFEFAMVSLLTCVVAAGVGCSKSSDSNTNGGAGGDGGDGGSDEGGSGGGGANGGNAGASAGGAGGNAAGSGGNAAGGAAGNAGGAAGGNAGTAGSGGTGMAVSALCPAGMTYGAPVPAGAMPMKLKDTGFEGTEGPVWIESAKAFFFSDLQRKSMTNWSMDASSKIWKYDPAMNKFEVLAAASGTNGLAVTNDGKLIGTLHSLGGLATFDLTTGAKTTFLAGVNDKPLGGPNDLAVRADGNIYFSDPEWQKPDGRQGQGQKVYRIDPAKVVTVVDTLSRPNGVTLSPDGNTLYVTDDMQNVWKYKVAANGTTTKDGKLTMTVGNYPDGMTADCAGNVYVATSIGVEIFSSAGAAVTMISGLKANGTNVAFGGTDHKTLFITSGDTSVYSMKLNVPGLPY